MNNNILALKDYSLQQLQIAIDRGYRIDLNQAIDARLVDEDNAKLLAKVRWLDSRIRFGCDTHAQIAQCERAIKLIGDAGYKGEFFLYTIIIGDMDECYERINHWRKRCLEKRKTGKGHYTWPHAQPYRDPQGLNTIPQWQKDMAGWCNKRMVFTACEFAEFTPRKGFKCAEYFKQDTNGEN